MAKTDRRVLQHVARPAGGTDDYEKAHQTSLIPRGITADAVEGDQERARYLKPTDVIDSHHVRKPHVGALLGKAYTILWEELKYLEEKVKYQQLDEAESRRYQRLVDSLAKLTKEEREQLAAEKLDELSKEELLLKAEEARRILEE